MSAIVKLRPMEKAQARIAGKHIFFAALTLSTPFVESTHIPTAATDMVKVYWNPGFIERCDTDEIIFVCLHEIMHILLKHGLRRGRREARLWNIACDHVINLKLKANGFKLVMHPEWTDFGPHGFLCFAHPAYDGLSEEQVYDKLIEERGGDGEPGLMLPNGQSGGPNHQDGFGEDIMPTSQDKTVSEIENKIDQNVARAVTIAKARGEMPAGFETLIKDFFEAQVPWEVVLARWMSRFVRNDSSWSRRNKRYVNMYLPGRKSMKIEEITIIGDSSGSMFNEKIFTRVGSEINYMIQRLKPDLVRVIWADDADCSNQEEFRRGEEVILHPKGGGGTDMTKPLAFVEQYDPTFVILITDAITPWPKEPTPYPLIVCNTTHFPVPDWAMEVSVTIEH